MKRFALSSCLALLAFALPTVVDAYQAAPAGTLPILGVWNLVAAKSDFGGGAALRSMVFKVTAASPDKIEYTVVATYESGTQGTWGFSGPADGKLYKLSGSESSYGYTMDAGVLTETQKDPDGTVTKGVWSLSKNGKEGTWTYTVTNPDGSLDHQKLVFAKAL